MLVTAKNLCFQQIPTDIALAAFRDKGLSSDEETMQTISRTLSIHEQRYQNQYKKKKPTYRIMTISGCERFLATGETTDHFIGFRPFTPRERQKIFKNMLKAAHENNYFIPLLLIDADYSYQYNPRIQLSPAYKIPSPVSSVLSLLPAAQLARWNSSCRSWW